MTAQTSYLVAYNSLSLLLWTYLTVATTRYLPALYHNGVLPGLYFDLLPLLCATQTLALLEVVHAVIGIVRASPGTTALQIGGKNLVVWTVMVQYVDVVALTRVGNWLFVGCLLAWGCSEIIRYGYFVAQLSTGSTPDWLKWLRYNAFLPLYPIGLLSEAGLVFLCLTTPLSKAGPLYNGYLFLGLLTYLPAGPYLYTHMLAQRRKVMKQLRLSGKS